MQFERLSVTCSRKACTLDWSDIAEQEYRKICTGESYEKVAKRSSVCCNRAAVTTALSTSVYYYCLSLILTVVGGKGQIICCYEQ